MGGFEIERASVYTNRRRKEDGFLSSSSSSLAQYCLHVTLPFEGGGGGGAIEEENRFFPPYTPTERKFLSQDFRGGGRGGGGIAAPNIVWDGPRKTEEEEENLHFLFFPIAKAWTWTVGLGFGRRGSSHSSFFFFSPWENGQKWPKVGLHHTRNKNTFWSLWESISVPLTTDFASSETTKPKEDE